MPDDQQNRDPNRSINVTKPQQSQAPVSNIDTSRVSAYTLREQQALERLKKQVGHLDQRDNRASHAKTIIAIVLVVVLIILAVLFFIIIGRTSNAPEEQYDMRLSMEIKNKSSLSVITQAGQELREINPGDNINLHAVIRNSNDIDGDLSEEGVTPRPIFVRFQIKLILNYEERFDIIIPEVSDRWYRYDAETEENYVGGATHDDHYFYYLGFLTFKEPEDLFTSITFNGDVLTCDDGGKYGQIQIFVDSIEADINNARNLWPTAPQGWFSKVATMS